MIATIFIVKKKAHTYKNIVISSLNEYYVAFLSITYPGRMHDKKVCDSEQYYFPDQADVYKDKGFQGFEPSNITTYQPKKKPRNEPRPLIDQIMNYAIHAVRVEIEHVIAGIKRSRIVKDIYRNYVLDVDDIMSIACGLHNFRVLQRSGLKYKTPIDRFLNSKALYSQ